MLRILSDPTLEQLSHIVIGVLSGLIWGGELIYSQFVAFMWWPSPSFTDQRSNQAVRLAARTFRDTTAIKLGAGHPFTWILTIQCNIYWIPMLLLLRQVHEL